MTTAAWERDIARWAGDVSNQRNTPEYCANASCLDQQNRLYGTAVSRSMFALTHRFLRKIGADTKSRTRDLLITNQLLYQLSYVGLLTVLQRAALFAFAGRSARKTRRYCGFIPIFTRFLDKPPCLATTRYSPRIFLRSRLHPDPAGDPDRRKRQWPLSFAV
jgi:hypothetical protein